MSLIGKTIGNYKVITKIGEGGMGSVYLGEHPLIGKRVAIKVLHPELASRENIVNRFFIEAKAVNDIGHPNIVDIVDFGRFKTDNTDTIYLVMEFLDGEGLNLRLKREGVSLDESLYILEQCASALQASHNKNIIHRDLKPENIYLIKRGADRNYVKLLDFGIAKLTGAESAGQSLNKTRAGVVIGTPSYMSPEQCDGRGDIDWRSDIYSLGIVFYETLTGQVPFTGTGFGEIVLAHLTQRPPLPSTVRPGIPRSLEAIALHAIEKRREDRFQSMDDLRRALEDPEVHNTFYHGAEAAWQEQDQGGALLTEGEISSPNNLSHGPRPTTLSGATGEMSKAPATRRKSHATLCAALGAGVAAMSLGVYFFLEARVERTPEITIQAAARVEPPPAPKDEDTQILVDSAPRGAKVFRAGQEEAIGITPVQLKVKRDTAEFDIVVRFPGYRDETRTIATHLSHDIIIPLIALPPPSPVALPAARLPLPPPPETASSKTSSHTARPASSRPAKSHHNDGQSKGDGDNVLEPTFN